MDVRNVLNFALVKGRGRCFYRLTNAEGKIWLMPAHHMKVGMNLYQPSGKNGKLLKALFPYLHRFGVVRKKIHAEVQYWDLADDFYSLLKNIFKTCELELSIFCGTPSVRQKIVIQVSKNKSILGYVKLSDNENVGQLFENEIRMLNFLAEKGFQDIPQVLYCGNLYGCYVFIQSTFKTIHSKMLHRWTPLHEDFLRQLYEKTVINITWKQTEFYSEVAYLSTHLNEVVAHYRPSVECGIKVVNKYYERVNRYSCFHADFTPWNMFVENNRLGVFDFEYAGYTYPPFMDMVHYVSQNLLIVKKYNVETAYLKLKQFQKCIDKYVDNSTVLIIAYLVHIFTFYLRLNGSDFNPSDDNYCKWLGLLKRYIV